MVKIINEISDLLEIKKSNTYDLREFDTVIIKFDLSTKCTIKANRIVCCDLTAPYVSCHIITSIGNIVCNSIKANIIVCSNLLSDYIIANNIQAMAIKAPIDILSFNISCDTILSRDITSHYLKCNDCFTDNLNVQEQHI